VARLSLQKIIVNKKLKNLMLALLGGLGISSAQAGLLSYQGVSFSSTWSGHVLTLEIDAASHTGDWAKAKGLAALELDGIGDYTSVSVSAAPSGASTWTTSSAELKAKGCSGDANGQAGSRLCFFGQQIALGDNMVFSFSFSGNAVKTVDPHVKVEFVNAKGGKVGSLLSQTLPASPSTARSSGATGTGTPPPSAPAAVIPAIPVTPDSAIVDAPVKEIPPAADLPTSIPLQTQTEAPAQSQAGAGSASPAAAVPEPQSIALLLGGLGAIGLALRRKRR
jgi:hypothetical protein